MSGALSPPAATAGEDGRHPGRLALAAWCLFDWANHAFPSIVITYVFAAYYTKAIAPTPERGTALWGEALSLTGIAIALASPVLGAIADQSGRRKPWLGALLLGCAAATAALWSVEPGSGEHGPLLLVGLGLFAYELGIVFYNAMLPDLAPPRLVGRLSGWGWGCGYAGGLACLALALLLLVQPEVPPFGLDKSRAEPVRATAFLAAAWMIVFALPLFLLAPDRRGRGLPAGVAVRQGVGALWRTLKRLPHHPN
ncbi:MAG: MFS transporter, partial [Rhodospirillaceae bacterium]|nr:MFS transporter [Rhodospirillaceae bacterium]